MLSVNAFLLSADQLRERSELVGPTACDAPGRDLFGVTGVAQPQARALAGGLELEHHAGHGRVFGSLPGPNHARGRHDLEDLAMDVAAAVARRLAAKGEPSSDPRVELVRGHQPASDHPGL